MKNKVEHKEIIDNYYKARVAIKIQKDFERLQQIVRECPECVQYDDDVKTLMHIAAEDGTPEMIEFLYHSGGDINKIYNELTPICGAVMFNKTDNVKMLIRLGAELDNEDSVTNPLLYTIRTDYRRGNKAEIAKLLIDAGTDLTIQYATRDGIWWDALSFARYYNNEEIAEMILEKFEKDGIDYDSIVPLTEDDFEYAEEDGIDYDSIEPFKDEVEEYYKEHPDSNFDEEILGEYLETAKSYMEDIEKFEQLSREKPEKYSLLLAYSYDRFAHYAYACDDLAPAEEYYECALTIYKQLAEKNPNKYLLELADSYHRIGRLYDHVFSRELPEEYYLKELQVRIELAEKDLHQFGKALFYCYDNIIEFYESDCDEQKIEAYSQKQKELQKQLSDCGVNMDTDTEKYRIVKQYIEEWHPFKEAHPNRRDVYGLEIKEMVIKINNDCSVERIIQIICDVFYHALYYSTFEMEECIEIAKKIETKISNLDN